VDGKVLTLHDRLILREPAGREVAQVHRKLVTLRPTYQISVAGQKVAAVRSTCSHPSLTSSRSISPGPTTWR
jgi:uncharacterized protein YxjI